MSSDITDLTMTQTFPPGDRAAQSRVGGAAGRSRAAAGGEPGRTGEFQEESADAAGAAGWQDL